MEETQKAIFDEKTLTMLQLQRLQVISSSGDSSGLESDYLQEKNSMRNIFYKKNEQEKQPFRRKLKELLWSYHKQKLSPTERRVMEGIKSMQCYTKSCNT